MKPINLYWFKLKDGSSNYGDELNYFIVREISDRKVVHIPYPYKPYKVPLIYFNNLLRKKGYANFRGMLRSLFAKQILFAIGSVLQVYDRNGITVWGSGIIKRDTKIHNASFRAVRGPETAKRLESLGYTPPLVFGDPALLLPLIIAPGAKRPKIGIVPNYIHYDEILNRNVSDDFVVIDMKGDIHSVTREITSCEYIIATSLHGLIIAHAYQIPALWVDLSLNSKLSGDDVKFDDYFLSVNIAPYKPFNLEFLNYNDIKILIENHQDRILINNNLDLLQKNLLKAFPFGLKEKYQFR